MDGGARAHRHGAGVDGHEWAASVPFHGRCGVPAVLMGQQGDAHPLARTCSGDILWTRCTCARSLSCGEGIGRSYGEVRGRSCGEETGQSWPGCGPTPGLMVDGWEGYGLSWGDCGHGQPSG